MPTSDQNPYESPSSGTDSGTSHVSSIVAVCTRLLFVGLLAIALGFVVNMIGQVGLISQSPMNAPLSYFDNCRLICRVGVIVFSTGVCVSIVAAILRRFLSSHGRGSR